MVVSFACHKSILALIFKSCQASQMACSIIFMILSSYAGNGGSADCNGGVPRLTNPVAGIYQSSVASKAEQIGAKGTTKAVSRKSRLFLAECMVTDSGVIRAICLGHSKEDVFLNQVCNATKAGAYIATLTAAAFIFTPIRSATALASSYSA